MQPLAHNPGREHPEYLLDRVLPRHFGKLADEAGLAKPLVNKRVQELTTTVIEALTAIELNQPDAEKIAKIIRERCEQMISALFTNKRPLGRSVDYSILISSTSNTSIPSGGLSPL